MNLIGTNISNLTDARFFAAYQPTLLFLSSTKAPDLEDQLQIFEAMKPWVEGPDWGKEIESPLTDLEAESVMKAGIEILLYSGNPAGYVRHPAFTCFLQSTCSEVLEQYESGSRFDGFIVTDPANLSLITQSLPSLFAQVKEVSEWDLLRNHLPKLSGIAMPGGEEEKVGVKSYDGLNDLLDEIFN